MFAAVLLGKGTELLCGYVAALIHEFAHLAVSLHLGCEAERITIGIGGINLKLKSASSIKKTIMILASGPLMSFFMFGALFLLRKMRLLSLPILEFANLCIGIVNLLPAMPLDGGAMLRTMVISHRGIINGAKIMKKVSAVLYAVLGVLCLAMHGAGHMNFFLVVFEFFLIYSSFQQYRTELIEKKRVLSGETAVCSKIKYIAVKSDCRILDVASKISPSYFLVAAVFDNGRFAGEVNQVQILDAIKNKGASCSIFQLLPPRS